MKYHINPELGPRPCRAVKKPCKYANSEHFENKAEAQESFKKKMKNDFGETSSLSKNNFSKSRVVDKDGNLLKVYHGSEIDFDVFDPSFTGRGNDSYGSGFYFNTSEDIAKGYGKTKTVNLNIANPIIVNGNDSSSLNNIEIPLSTVKKLMKHIPNIYNQPDDDEMNPLGDYSPDFWDKSGGADPKDRWSRKELEAMMDSVAEENYSDADFTTVENLFGRDGATELREALLKETDWDGVQVKFNDGSSHWIAWSPEQIKILEED